MFKSSVSPSIWNSEGDFQLQSQSVNLSSVSRPNEHQFNPYEFNGGTTVVISGRDYAIAAGDTRMSAGYEILSRNQSKLYQLTSKSVLAIVGCVSDITTFVKQIQTSISTYAYNHDGQEMPLESIAQLISVTLYYRRFFPYYAFCALSGIDEHGVGGVYGYDAVGSFKRDLYGSMGSGQNYIVPFLDMAIGHKNIAIEMGETSRDEAVRIVKEAFVAAGERDIYTGDAVEIQVIEAGGISKVVFELKKD